MPSRKLAPREWLTPPRAFGHAALARPTVPVGRDGQPRGSLPEMTAAFLQHLFVLRISQQVTLRDMELKDWCDAHAADFDLSSGHLQNVFGGWETMTLPVAGVAARLLGEAVWVPPESVAMAVQLAHDRYATAVKRVQVRRR